MAWLASLPGMQGFDGFAWPWLLLALPLPWLLRLLLPPAPGTAPALKVPYGERIAAIAGARSGARHARGPGALAWLGWALLCLAAARPQQLGPPVQPPQAARDLMLAVDLSGSMRDEDMALGGMAVDRLTAAKAVLADFLDRRAGDRVGLIVFGDRAYALTPLTRDLASVRPARTIIPGGRFDNIDLLLIRENLEGLYIGHEHYVQIDDDPHAVAMATGINTRQGCRHILEYAFEHAIALGRKKVTVVHKANIMKALTGIFLETAQQMHAERYAGRIEMDSIIVDACAMKLVLNPWQFDVLVTTNLFGDILSDLTAGLVGGLGMAPGANIGADAAIFEAVHGSAPDIAGKGLANPTALLLAAAQMLDHVKLGDSARRLRQAIDDTLNVDQVRTGDLGGKASTSEYTRALVSRLGQG
jgi:isocitrate dehydrogenase (NAD+)